MSFLHKDTCLFYTRTHVSFTRAQESYWDAPASCLCPNPQFKLQDKYIYLALSVFHIHTVWEGNEGAQGWGDGTLGKVPAVHSRDLTSDLQHPGTKLGAVAHSFNPRAIQAETGELLGVAGQPI